MNVYMCSVSLLLLATNFPALIHHSATRTNMAPLKAYTKTHIYAPATHSLSKIQFQRWPARRTFWPLSGREFETRCQRKWEQSWSRGSLLRRQPLQKVWWVYFCIWRALMGDTRTFQSSRHNRAWIMNVSTVNIPAMWLLSSTSFSLSASLIFSLPPYPIGFLSWSHLLIFTSLSLSAILLLPPSTFQSPSPRPIYHLPLQCSHLIFPSRNAFSSNHLRSPLMT